ncbi:hypothetical protein HDU79_006971 [Rhizoclosmatium sp. JEL0117]|nr:hypothetical protein HDU79_006971 [Rhizoclosmatium sp. JEL0117]
MGKTVAIIGAGPAGIVAAIALKKQGYEPTLYDKIDPVDAIQWLLPPTDTTTHKFGDGGGTLSLFGNGLRALQYAGLLEEVETLRCVSNTKMIYALQDGSDRSTRTFSSKKAEFEPLHVLRSELHAVLIKAAYARGITTLAGKSFVSLQEKGNEVIISFADGTRVSADFVIGADGVHSKVRSSIFPEAPLPTVWGTGFVGEVELGERRNGPTVTLSEQMALHIDPLGGRGFYHSMYSPTAASFNFLEFADTPLPQTTQQESNWKPFSNLAVESTLHANALASFGFKKTLVECVRNARRLAPLSLVDLPDLPFFHKSRVVLIGDAAHGTLPTYGQGINLAIEDAVTLTDLLVYYPPTDPTIAFSMYDKIRKPHVQAVSKHSRVLATRMRARNQIEMRVGRLIMRTVFAVQESFGVNDDIYDHDCREDVAAVVPGIKFVV